MVVSLPSSRPLIGESTPDASVGKRRRSSAQTGIRGHHLCSKEGSAEEHELPAPAASKDEDDEDEEEAR